MTLGLIFGTAIARILDTLMLDELGNRDLSVAEIAKWSACSRRTVFRAMETLSSMEIITITRTVGRAKMYKINRKSSIAKYMMLFSMEMDKR
jgi:DNA-binding IclR family transcriptional regulator